jgi:hypothetical protein
LNNTKKVELNPISSLRPHVSREWKPQPCIMCECVRERERRKRKREKREMSWKTYHNDVCCLDWMFQECFQMCTINIVSQTSAWPNHLPLSSSPWPNCCLSLPCPWNSSCMQKDFFFLLGCNIVVQEWIGHSRVE